MATTEQTAIEHFEDAFNHALWMLVHGSLMMRADCEDEDEDSEAHAEHASVVVSTLLAHAVLLSTSFLSKSDASQMIAKAVREALDDTVKGGHLDA